MIPQGVEVYVATEAVDMRLGFERLGALVRERMGREPKTRALFVFFGKRRHTVKILTWDGTGMMLVYKKLDTGWFEVPVGQEGEAVVQVSEAVLEEVVACVNGERNRSKKRTVH